MCTVSVGKYDSFRNRKFKRKDYFFFINLVCHFIFRFQVSKSFKTWRERFQRNMRNLEVLEEHLQKKESELLHYCLVKWVKFMLRCKAEKSYEKKIVHKVSLQS